MNFDAEEDSAFDFDYFVSLSKSRDFGGLGGQTSSSDITGVGLRNSNERQDGLGSEKHPEEFEFSEYPLITGRPRTERCDRFVFTDGRERLRPQEYSVMEPICPIPMPTLLAKLIRFGSILQQGSQRTLRRWRNKCITLYIKTQECPQ